ncbi:hypothetical protein BT096_11875, partial [Corynebacterium diphtheriae]
LDLHAENQRKKKKTKKDNRKAGNDQRDREYAAYAEAKDARIDEYTPLLDTAQGLESARADSYTHLRAPAPAAALVCRLLRTHTTGVG